MYMNCWTRSLSKDCVIIISQIIKIPLLKYAICLLQDIKQDDINFHILVAQRNTFVDE
jgi:hypothetical protein